METIKDVSDFCSEFTCHNRYNVEKVIELNHVRDGNTNVFPENGFINYDFRIRVLFVIEDIPLMVIYRKVEIIDPERKILRKSILQLLRLEKLYKE